MPCCNPIRRAALKLVAAAGHFTSVYVGYADKTAKFSDPSGIPPDYDPTARPWYKQAVAAGKLSSHPRMWMVAPASW